MTTRPAPSGSMGDAFRVAKQRAWRLWLRSQFLLFQRHRHNQVVVETVVGAPMVVVPGVLNPKLFVTGEFLAETLSGTQRGQSASGATGEAGVTGAGSDEPLIPAGATVLDMGTGSGVGAVFAARRASRVVAVDINPAAVRCAQINALLNQVEGTVEVLHGDLFAPVAGRRFDVILFNPPFFLGEPRNDFERALWSNDVMERFVAGLARHLQPGGHLVLLLSSIGEERPWVAALQDAGFRVVAVAQRNLVSEVLTIYRVDRAE